MQQTLDTYKLASSSWDDEELAAIDEVISKQQFTMGESVTRFEQEFVKKFGNRYAVMMNSGSSANLLVIAALCYKSENPLKAGDEIIVPSLSWSTTYYPIHQYGMKMVFVDIDLQSLNLDIAQLKAALSPKTRGIMIPNILGNPAKLRELQAFCNEHQLYLIEDNCESMGAKLDGIYTGGFGICGTHSTFFAHHMSTMEGGVAVTDDEELYHLLLALRSHGWTRHLPEKNRLCEKSSDPFYEYFRFIVPGYNVRPIEMAGAIGCSQLKKLDGFLVERSQNAKYFQSLFAKDDRFILQKEHGQSSWYGFSLVLKKECGIPRNRVIAALRKAAIEVRPIVSGNFLKNDVIQYLNHRVVGEHINAQYVHDQGLFVGNHQFSIKNHLDHLYETLRAID